MMFVKVFRQPDGKETLIQGFSASEGFSLFEPLFENSNSKIKISRYQRYDEFGDSS
jgi:hypothetical protein